MDINIFLASSSELKEDRKDFQVFISQLNVEWADRDICFRLTIWEDFIDSMSTEGLQQEYNLAAKNCDIFLMLFFTKVGEYTAQEFETVFNEFQVNKKPLIYTYFKETYISTGQINREIISMLEFKEKLQQLKHYVTVYTNIDNLQWHFSRQLEKLYGNEFSANYDLNRLTNTKIDSLAIETVCKILSPQTDDSTVENLKSKVNELINKASEFGKNASYQLAKVNRRSNRTSDIRLMERSIPIFEALVNSNKRKNRHDYFGQLAYALKDKNEADWEEAEENFNTAIIIRGNSEPEYFYEFNRAICKVGILNKAVQNMQTDDYLRELILKDLKYAKSGIGNQFEQLINEDIDNRLLSIWLNENRINLESL